ncbi:hypothetical protein SALBM311S_09835 [Streptomyces alboniger]
MSFSWSAFRSPSCGRCTAVWPGNRHAQRGNQIEPFLWLRDYVEEQRANATGSALAPDRLASGIELRDVRYTYRAPCAQRWDKR